MRIDYRIPAVKSYINWDYFYYAWGIHNKPDEEKLQLREEAKALLRKYGYRYQTHALFLLLEASSDGEDIVVSKEQEQIRLPFLRQQHGNPCLCLADFVAPKQLTASCAPLVLRRASSESGLQLTASTLTPPPSTLHLQPSTTHHIGIFATTVDAGMEHDFDEDPYEKMMMQLLADRLAEATAERLHKEVRQTYWGYAKNEHLPMDELHTEQFQGIRPAVGYPSLPDASINFLLDELLDMQQIGIELTESGAMRPHASVSGLMFAHPQARYFDVGKIDEAQLKDYACRRGLPIEEMRRFLTRNL